MRVLYDYFRSSASYRVRIALNLKGLAYDSVPVSLLDNAQRAPEYLSKNPQGLVPALLDGEQLLTQSLAICEYLEETYPQPALLPNDAIGIGVDAQRQFALVSQTLHQRQILARHAHVMHTGQTIADRRLQCCLQALFAGGIVQCRNLPIDQ